jgi:hypothetical protein
MNQSDEPVVRARDLRKDYGSRPPVSCGWQVDVSTR